MRILFSVTNLDLGGAQMFVMRLAEELLSQGHEVYVYNHQPEWSNSDFISSFSDKIKIISIEDNILPVYLTWKLSGLINKFDKRIIFRNWVNERKYKKTLKKYKIDVISSQMFVSDKLNAKIAFPLGVPFVITTHGEYELNLHFGNVHYNKEARNILLTASAVIYTAEKNFEAIRSLLPADKPISKILLGFNGDRIKRYDVDRASLGINEEDFVIGMVARGIPEKGWIELIEMYQILKKTYSKRKIHLIMVGNGESLKKLFEERKIEGMHLFQFSQKPMEYFSWMAKFDAGALLSYFAGESVPNAVIEYLYHGLPVLSTPMGDIERMISSEQGMAGELVPMKNGKADVNASVEIMKKWLDNPEYFAQLKRNTSAAFEKFSMHTIGSKYVEVYKEAIEYFKKVEN